MKIIKIINLVFAIVLTTTCVAQVKFGEIKTKTSTYVYEPVVHATYKPLRPGGGLITVAKKNSIPEIYSKSHTTFTRYEFTGYTMDKPLTKSIAEVFSKDRLNTLGSEKLVVNMYLDLSGKVISVRYFIYPTSKVVTEELENLEDAIKRNVQFKFSATPNGPLAPFTVVISFDRFYSNKSPW